MLSGFFNYDNPVWRFIGKFFDLLVLNILWFVCSIPVITSGAATTAVYYVTLKLVKDEEGPIISSFFKSFKENLRQATAIWLIVLVAGGLLCFDLYFFLVIRTTADAFRTIMLSVFGGLSLICLSITTYVFPIQAKFYNPVKRTIFNAFFMSVRHLLQTMGILAIDAGIIAFGVFLMPQVLILFGFPLIAFVNSYVFTGIFNKYIPKEEKNQEDELKPLFLEDES